MRTARPLLVVALLVLAGCGTQGDRSTDDAGGPLAPPGLPGAVVVGPDGTAHRLVTVDGDQAGAPAEPVTAATLLSADDHVVVVGFWMGPDSCWAVADIDVTETGDGVDLRIDMVRRPGTGPCAEIAEARAVEVRLSEPLGNRALSVAGVPVG